MASFRAVMDVVNEVTRVASTGRVRAHPHGTILAVAGGRTRKPEEDRMEINWNRDADAALETAAQSGTPVLLDFSAAPM